MRTTRAVYLLLAMMNGGVNGWALYKLDGGGAAVDGVVPAALVFNLIFLPVAVFAAYRMGGMAEEEYLRTMAARPGQVAPPAPSATDERNGGDAPATVPAAQLPGTTEDPKPSA